MSACAAEVAEQGNIMTVICSAQVLTLASHCNSCKCFCLQASPPIVCLVRPLRCNSSKIESECTMQSPKTKPCTSVEGSYQSFCCQSHPLSMVAS